MRPPAATILFMFSVRGVILNEDPEPSGSSQIAVVKPSVTGRSFGANENSVPESVQAYGMSEH